MNKQFHPFHLVNNSPWPLLTSMSALMITGGTLIIFLNHYPFVLILGISTLIMNMALWWRDVARESTFQGSHTSIVTTGLKLGMILFIISEILFFMSFFWAFFHNSLSVSVELNQWPPKNITSFNPFHIPLLNTMILLSSGFSITWAHHALLNNNKTQALPAMTITILLGIYFSTLQAYEYAQAPFTIADSVYGSCFFMATGFHGLHVIIGTIFITISLSRLRLNHLTANHHFGFEAAAWYWHFVDVVWLLLYTSIYWWGGN